MNYPTIGQLRAATKTGNRNYLAEQEVHLSSCLRSWRAGIEAALNSVVKNNIRTYRVTVSPGGSYPKHILEKAHSILKEEICKEIPGVEVQHESFGVDSLVINWEEVGPIF